MSDILTEAHPEPDSTFRLENPRKLPTNCGLVFLHPHEMEFCSNEDQLYNLLIDSVIYLTSFIFRNLLNQLIN